MASSSTLSTGQIWLYDVFVSFRGEDTRVNFVDRLHHALKQRRINVYQDEVMIDKWITFGDEHIRAIEQSRFYIIVFSKNYASSRCCMDELVKIMQCHEKKVHTAYSIFYDVKQTEIRKLTEEVGEAFSNHENAGKWREALKKAANLPGWESVYAHIWQVNLLIQNIVNMILQESYSNDSVFDGQMIGMETRVKDVVSYLEKDVNDVRMIGIKGMGGSGKTTLARAVYDIISFNFERKSFVENVREVSKASSNGLKSLQNQVLMDVLKMQGVRVSSVDGGKNLMKKVMCDRKVLLVLDDVDHIDQLEGLAGDLRWFMPGSRIIITTRDEQVLKVHRVNVILDVKLLSHKEAICLFSKYAFGEDIPIHGYEEFSAQVVRYAEGLPSTVRDAGSFLRGKDESEWINAIEKLKKKSMEETLEKRKISNIGLKEDYKENFPDAACLDKGWKKDRAIRVLESCGFHVRNPLRFLEQKSPI